MAEPATVIGKLLEPAEMPGRKTEGEALCKLPDDGPLRVRFGRMMDGEDATLTGDQVARGAALLRPP
jgi:hypothetical protein